jgi:hypothetical protein
MSRQKWVGATLVALVAILGTGADECERVPPEVEVGRYWAQLKGYGTPSVPLTVWFEYRLPSNPTGWGFVSKTPERLVPANTDLSTHVEWLYGLEPGTTYEYRMCIRLESGESACDTGEPTFSFVTAPASGLRFVEIDPNDPKRLALDDGSPFVPWGNNYVGVGEAGPNSLVGEVMHDDEGLAMIRRDFERLANSAPPDGVLNVTRMHFELMDFLEGPTTPNREALARLARVIELAEDEGLRVMVTGLGYLYPADNPLWIAQQNEEEHWASQALWWNSVASALKHSPGVFAYDLINEPYVGGGPRTHDGLVHWVNVAPDEYCAYGANPDLGVHGSCFGQFLTPDMAGRTTQEVATAWTEKMVHGIRYSGWFQNDPRHLVTIGTVPSWLGAPFNTNPGVAAALDFMSPHLYASSGDGGQSVIDLAASLSALSGKPVVAGEMFPFTGIEDVGRIIANTCNANTAQGWIGQYDARTLEDECPPWANPYGCALFDTLYALQGEWSAIIRAGECPPPVP